MANNKIQVKRTSVSGRTANVTSSGNSQFIDAGEFALNMTDGILYTSNGSTLITVGSNLVNQNITGTLEVNSISSNVLFTSTGAVKLPVGTLLQRPTGVAGQLRFNSNTAQFEGYNGTDWGSIGGSVEWVAVSNTYTASSGDAIMATTTAGSFTITLPSSPLTGAIVIIADGDDFFVNPLTVNGNGNLIEGYSTFTLNVKNVKVEFIYSGTSWQAFPTITTLTAGLSTNLTLTSNSSTVSINSDTGTDITILAANSTTAGVLTATNQTIAGDKTFTGNVGIGTLTPQAPLSINLPEAGGEAVRLSFTSGGTTQARASIGFGRGDTTVHPNAAIAGQEIDTSDLRGNLLFSTRDTETDVAPTERMRITSAGLVGINNNDPVSTLDVVGTVAASSYTTTGADSTASQVMLQSFRNGSGVQTGGAVRIRSRGDGTNNAVQMIFDTDSTERMRIDSSGHLSVGKTEADIDVAGATMYNYGLIGATVSGATCLIVNRLTDDGGVMSIRQAGATEGTITVSGTTVSYNGGHLSRWAQFPDNSRPELLKGTVMSNLDQMSVWGDEDNEQLNCVQVSTVEGDANVAGVFVAWDNTDDGYNDILLAMTGDMVIRIANGTTVQRGDLLMSAGDGTAKPQEDDIVRSKTIAKVTSTHVSHTYADGSYAVPCVLMAC